MYKYILCLYFTLILGCSPNQNALERKIQNFENTTNTTKSFIKVNPNAPKETAQWSSLIGEWKCLSKDLNADNKWIENKATWKWIYILDGYAIQDYWYQEINDPNSTEKAFYGTNIRIYNPKENRWEITWVNNKSLKVGPLIYAKKMGDNIVMKGAQNKMEVTFYDIQQNSFKWKAELINQDSTKTLISEIFGTRIK